MRPPERARIHNLSSLSFLPAFPSVGRVRNATCSPRDQSSFDGKECRYRFEWEARNTWLPVCMNRIPRYAPALLPICRPVRWQGPKLVMAMPQVDSDTSSPLLLVPFFSLNFYLYDFSGPWATCIIQVIVSLEYTKLCRLRLFVGIGTKNLPLEET